MNICEDARLIMELLGENGYQSYFVGGCVRDELMGKSSADIDIATSALPFETKKILSENSVKVVETGIKHGTVTAVINKTPYEITTFRKDGDYKDCRRPESVDFVTDVEEDLSRRDFTINAMAYNYEDGLVDLFGGKVDLKNKIIRTVGDPTERFNEDALRIMRALRFASVLGFEIEENTKKAILDNKEKLNNIAAERIFSELTKMLTGDNVLKILTEYREVIGVIIPELKPAFNCEQHNPWHIYNVYGHIIHAVDSAPKDKILRLAMLLHDIGKPQVKTTDENGKDHFKTHAQVGAEIAKTVLKRFKVSREIYDKVITLIYYHQSIEDVDNIKVKRWLSKIGEDYTRSLFQIRVADLLAHNPEKIKEELRKMVKLQKELEETVAAGAAFKLSDLAVNGSDLIALGYRGREIGEKLNEILSLVVDNKIENNKETILKYIKKHRA